MAVPVAAEDGVREQTGLGFCPQRCGLEWVAFLRVGSESARLTAPGQCHPQSSGRSWLKEHVDVMY